MTWLRLDDDFASDGTIRRCRAVQWWPLILCAMKRGGGVASDDDIAADVLADIGQGSEDAAGLAVERMKAAGRIVAVPGGWSTPDWGDVQRETTSTERVRRHREKLKRTETDETVSCVSPRSVEHEETVERPTVHYVTEQNDDDTRVTAHPSPPAPTVAEATQDEVQTKIQGHPAHDALLPIARVAFQVLGVCPEVYTLESWFQQRYSLPRIEYGLKQAKQAAMGQWVPVGKVIISAGRWMQNARPEEYQQGPQSPAQGPETARPVSAPQLETRKPLTPEETAEMLKELGV